MTMRPFFQFLILTAAIALVGCQTVEQVSIDYLIPADVSFPSEIRKVGVVNNVKIIPDDQMPAPGDKQLSGLIAHMVSHRQGDGKKAAESMAETIADNNYFDLVVICDSALYVDDGLPGRSNLSKEDVESLTRDLGVDMLVSLENVQIKATRAVRFIADWGGYWGTMDADIHTTVRLYLPNRHCPMTTIIARDSIFWEYSERDPKDKIITDEEMINEASAFAGTIPVKHLIPHWKNTSRFIYANGSTELRDATFHVRRNAWKPAFDLWQRVYNREKKDKKLMQAALNIALYYEVSDDLDNALLWAEKAKGHAAKAEGVDESLSPAILSYSGKHPNHKLIADYLKVLEERKAEFFKLKAQTDRFNEE